MIITHNPTDAMASVAKQMYRDIPYNDLPDTGAAFNEWPNPMWNTTRYEWHATYPSNSLEYRAQFLAKTAMRIGLRYTATDAAKEQIARSQAYRTEQENKHRHDNQVRIAPTPSVIMPAPSVNAPLKSAYGILTDTHLYFQHKGAGAIRNVPLTRTPDNAGDIMQLALDYGLAGVWVLSNTRMSDVASKNFVDCAYPMWTIKRPQYSKVPRVEDSRCTFLRGWKNAEHRSDTENGNTICIGYAEHGTDWFLDDINNPVTLLATLAYIEDVVGLPILYSTGTVGKMLMKKCNGDKERLAWIRPVDLHGIAPIRETATQDIAWRRALTDAEHAMSHLVAYDKNMMYPASCTSVLLGAGMPTYCERPSFDTKKSPTGLWHVRITGTSEFNGVELPHPTDGILDGWFYTYTVKLLHEVGYTVEIVEAYIWTETHTTLRSYAEKLWAARVSVDDTLTPDVARYKSKEARALAKQAIKMIAVKSLGFLAHPPDDTDGVGAYDWYRPDWFNLIKDNAKYRMFWRMRSFIKKGYTPVGIHADCLYYIADSACHEQAVPDMMSSAGKLGGYKQKYKTPLTVAQIAPLFDNTALDMMQVNQALLAIDETQLKDKEV